jgi:hypothetical protein
MPTPDPTPGTSVPTRRRFWRLFRLLALLSAVVAVIAVALVARGDDGFHPHMLIATALGVGLTVLLGTALMTLAFLSAEGGHDDQASTRRKDDRDNE